MGLSKEEFGLNEFFKPSVVMNDNYTLEKCYPGFDSVCSKEKITKYNCESTINPDIRNLSGLAQSLALFLHVGNDVMTNDIETSNFFNMVLLGLLFEHTDHREEEKLIKLLNFLASIFDNERKIPDV